MPVTRPDGKTVICTLGMHRSGTSVVSRMLNLLGVHLGPTDAMSAPGEDNPKGYWEHHPLALLNDEILATLGGRWDAPPVVRHDWTGDPRLEGLKAKARQLIVQDFAAEPLWGWKDPRTCITLPFWQEIIGPLRYVICIRNPAAVAASLGRRNGMSIEQGEQLWLTHVQASLAHTTGQPRIFVFYDDIMDDWASELRRMAAFIGRPDRAEDPRIREALGGFLDGELCHHRLSTAALAADEQISLAAKSLYFTLRDYHALAAREMRARQTIASLESEAERIALERDSYAQHSAVALQVLQEIHASSAWRLVLSSRRAIGRVLPTGTRRRRIFDVMVRPIVQRVPSPPAPSAAADLRVA